MPSASCPPLAGVLAVFTTFLAAKALFRPEETEEQRTRPEVVEGLKIKDNNVAYSLLFNLSPYLPPSPSPSYFPPFISASFGLRAMLFVPVETMAVACFWQGIAPGRARRLPSWAWLALAGFGSALAGMCMRQRGCFRCCLWRMWRSGFGGIKRPFSINGLAYC
ncbi:MAG: hypothetical protein M5U34_14975 [Chloroflexi bacterium]|nr:hypothetical protein [Chloroflexota bacterium]